MKKIFSQIASLLLITFLLLSPALSATKAKQVDFLLSQVRNSVGSLAGGTITFYGAGGTTLKTIWLDRDKSSAAANPYTLDANGTAQLYADGSYKIVIKNAAGSTIYTRDNLFFHYSDNLYEVDALDEYGGGTSFTQATIQSALTAIGTSNKVILLLRPGTWIISSNTDWSAYTNVTLKTVPGTVISHGAFTVKLPGMFEGSENCLLGSGLVTFQRVPYSIIATWFGAIGDDSTDNTSALQSFINSAQVSEGRWGHIPFGTYRHTGLTITGDVKITGDNSASGGLLSLTSSGTKLKCTHLTNANITISNSIAWGTVLEDIYVSGDTLAQPTQTGSGIVIDAEVMVTLNRLFIRFHGGHGIWLSPNSHTDVISILRSYIGNNGGSGIYGRGYSTKQINAINILSNHIQSNAISGINLCGNLVNIKDNVIQSTGIGIFLSGEDVPSDTSLYVTGSAYSIQGNYFEANLGGDIIAECSYSPGVRVRSMQYVTISNNTFSQGGATYLPNVSALITLRRNMAYDYYDGFYYWNIRENKYGTTTYETTLSVPALLGATSVTVVSSTGLVNGRYIGITGDSGVQEWFYASVAGNVVSLFKDAEFTLPGSLTAAAAAGNTVRTRLMYTDFCGTTSYLVSLKTWLQDDFVVKDYHVGLSSYYGGPATPSVFEDRIRYSTSKPTAVPDFRGQRHVDNTTKRFWIAPDTISADSWRPINDGSIVTLANSATPSVALGRYFLTGGTTTITNFLLAYPGQVITIISEHAITITDGTNIFLAGSANFVMAATDTLTLVCKADYKWYELGRSVN